MKRLVTVIISAILIAALAVLGFSDTNTAANTNVDYIETYLEEPEAGNSSASATITITMYTGDEEESS